MEEENQTRISFTMQQALASYKDALWASHTIFLSWENLGQRLCHEPCRRPGVGGHRSPGRSKVHQGVTDEGAEIVFPTPLRKTVCPLNPGVKVFQTESAKKQIGFQISN